MSLRLERDAEHIDTGQISARSSKAGHEPGSDRIGSRADEDDGDRRGRRFCGKRRDQSTGGDEDRYLRPNEIGCQIRQSTVLTVGPPILDGNIGALDKAGFAEPLAKRADEILRFCRRPAAEKTDDRD